VKVYLKTLLLERSKMATGTQMQTARTPWIRDFAVTMETELTEVKHKGEKKLQHCEPPASGRLLHAMILWKNRRTVKPMPLPSAHQAAARPPAHQHTDRHLPACQPPAPNVLGRPSADQTEYFPGGATLGKKKKSKRRNKTLKPWTPAHKKLLHATLHWENRRAPAPPDTGSKSA
jgi:hypothetical protein